MIFFQRSLQKKISNYFRIFLRFFNFNDSLKKLQESNHLSKIIPKTPIGFSRDSSRKHSEDAFEDSSWNSVTLSGVLQGIFSRVSYRYYLNIPSRNSCGILDFFFQKILRFFMDFYSGFLPYAGDSIRNPSMLFLVVYFEEFYCKSIQVLLLVSRIPASILFQNALEKHHPWNRVVNCS